MTLKPTLISIAGAIAYMVQLGILMLFGYLMLVLSVPGVGDTHKWSQSVNYICSAGLAFGIISTGVVLGFSMFGKLFRGFAFGIPIGVLGAAVSTYLPAPLLSLA